MGSDTRDKNMIVQSFKNRGVSSEVLALISDDADYGLTREQIAKYADKNMDIERMRIFSECMRNGYDENVTGIITADGLNTIQMKMALEFYKKGVPIENVEEITGSGEKAVVMKKYYENILEKMDGVNRAAAMEPEYVKKLTEHIEEVVLSIGNMDKKFDAIADALKSLVHGRQEQEELDRVLKENQEKDRLLSQKQDEINKAYSQAAENRKEVEMLKKENEVLKEKVLELEERGEAKRTENKISDTGYYESSNSGIFQPTYSSRNIRINSNDIERKAPGNSRSAIGFFTRLGIKKKSRKNLVKLVINGELDRNQLIQIKSAIEKGLTESQLEEIINSRVPAERMKEIIEIAELENSLQG